MSALPPPLENIQANADDPPPIATNSSNMPAFNTVMFVNGTITTKSTANIESYKSSLGIWGGDDGITPPNFTVTGVIPGTFCTGFGYKDITLALDSLARNKLNICGQHVIPAFKAVTKGKQSKTASIIDQDNWNECKLLLKAGDITLGFLLSSNLECGQFAKFCKITQFFSDKKRKRDRDAAKQKAKQTTTSSTTFIAPQASQSNNPFQAFRRQQFASRAGFNPADVEFIFNSREHVAHALKRVFIMHPVLKQSQKAAALWAKESVKGTPGFALSNKMPVAVRKVLMRDMMHFSAQTAQSQRETHAVSDVHFAEQLAEQKCNQLFNELGIEDAPVTAASGVDDDSNVHDLLEPSSAMNPEEDVAALKKKWMKDVEKDFKEQYMKKLMGIADK
eukprot:224575_1